MSITIQYWNITARAVFAQALAAAGGIEAKLNDTAANLWPTCNANNGISKEECPFGQMPVLTVEGKDGVIAESEAIARYVATIAGLIPSDPWVAAKSDMVWARCFGTWNELTACQYSADKAAAWEKFGKTTVVEKFAPLEKMLAKSGTTFFAGDKISASDVVFYTVVQLILMSNSNSDPLHGFPLLAKNLEATRATGSLAEFTSKMAAPYYKV
jgi:glutathione S-transferase